MIGLPVEQLRGRTLRESVPELADELEPRLREVLATGEPVYNVEIRGVTRAQPGVERIWVGDLAPAPGQPTGGPPASTSRPRRSPSAAGCRKS